MGMEDIERLRRLALMGDKQAAEDLLRLRARAGHSPTVRSGQVLIEPDLWTPIPRSAKRKKKIEDDPLREEYEEILEEERREAFEETVGEARKRHQQKKISKSSEDSMSDLFAYVAIPVIAFVGIYALYKISQR